jgi:hypothetical protein
MIKIEGKLVYRSRMIPREEAMQSKKRFAMRGMAIKIRTGNIILTLFVLIILVACENAISTAAPAVTETFPAKASVLQTATHPIAVTATVPVSTVIPTNSTGLSGPYLGQKTPGVSPAIFAPGIISGEIHTPPVFTPDGREAYWGMSDNKIYLMRLENGYWTRPENIVFSASMTDYRDQALFLVER